MDRLFVFSIIMEEKMDSNARVFGYARVSSQEQNLDRQIDALKVYVDEAQYSGSVVKTKI